MQLCNVLSNAHNELMDVLQTSSTALLPRTAMASDTALPTVSYQSSPEVMRQQLLSYSPARDLLPLLAAYRLESDSQRKGKGGGSVAIDQGGGGVAMGIEEQTAEPSSSFDLQVVVKRYSSKEVVKR